MTSHKSSEYPIYPICISTPFAVGDVYSYLIVDEKIVLIDTGHYADDAFDTISQHLSAHGLAVKDLDEIWLTHGHPDHYGQAARLADISGAQVYGHRKERENFSSNTNAELFKGFLNRHSIPEQFVEQMLEQLVWLQQYQLPVEPQWIEEGDELSSGSIKAEVHLTPGHAPGHLTFLTDAGIIFSGDLLLGEISTNALVNFDAETGKRNKSLLQYRSSLKWISKQEGLVLPGHGNPINNIAQVAKHHLEEHEKRYQEIQKILLQKSMTLLQIAQQMFTDAIKNGATFLVLSEVLGYLDWGIAEGTIEVDEQEMIYKSA